MPFGMLGSSSEDRPCLLVGPDGGNVVRTPVSAPEQNTRVRTADIVVRGDGSATLSVQITMTGNQQHGARGTWMDTPPDKRATSLLSSHGVGDGRIRALEVEGVEERRPEVSVRAESDLATYASRSPNRLFVPLNPFARTARPPANIERRLSPMKLSYRWFDVDSIRIVLPAGFVVEALPSGMADSVSFGTYQLTVEQASPLDLLVVRRMTVTESLLPAESYAEYRSFFTTAAKGDRLQIVLRRE
jgi:hypothetical protein